MAWRPSGPVVAPGSTALAIANKMFAKEPNDARVEVAVKGRSVKAGRIGTKTRQVRRELRRARCQEGKVTGRHDVNVRLARQAISDTRGARRTHASSSQFGSPELQGNIDCGQIILRENFTRWIDNHCSADTRIMWPAGRSFVVKSSRRTISSGVTPREAAYLVSRSHCRCRRDG